MRREVERAGHVELIAPAAVTGIRAEPGCHRLVLATMAGRRVLRAPLLVGADGPRSSVRRAAGIDAEVRRDRGGWVEVIAPRPDGQIEDGHVFVGRGEFLGVAPTRTRELVTFHLTRSGDHAEYRAGFGTITELRRRYVTMAPILTASLDSVTCWEQVTYAPTVRVRAQRWVANGIALVGDAAVAVNPITSQGACLALSGGVRLATVVGCCFARNDLSARALAPYEAWCRPEAEAVQTVGDLCLWGFSTRNPAASWLKERMLRRFDADPRRQRYVLGFFSGMHEVAHDGLGWREALAAAGLWRRTRGLPAIRGEQPIGVVAAWGSEHCDLGLGSGRQPGLERLSAGTEQACRDYQQHASASRACADLGQGGRLSERLGRPYARDQGPQGSPR